MIGGETETVCGGLDKWENEKEKKITTLREKLKVEDELDCLLTVNEVRAIAVTKLDSFNYALEQQEKGNVTKAYRDYAPVAVLENILDTIENGHMDKQRQKWLDQLSDDEDD